MKTIKMTGLGIAIAASMAFTGAGAQERLTMGATHSASSFYAYQVGIANFLNNAVDGIDVNVRELGGAEVSTEALLAQRGRHGHFGHVFRPRRRAGRGTVPRTGGQPSHALFLCTSAAQFRGGGQQRYRNVSDLEGEPFNPGGRGTSTEGQVDKVFDTIGVSPDLVRAEGSDALDAFQNRQIVGFVKGGINPDGYIEQAASSRDIRMLSLTDEQREAVTEAYPFFSSAQTNPDEFYGDSGGPVDTVQTAIGINTTAALPEQIAYDIAKAIFSDAGKTAASEVYKPAAGIDAAQLTIDAAVAPLHAGVVRYLEEEGYTVPDAMTAE